MKKIKKQLTTFAILAGLMLGIKDGYVALWKDEDPQPYRIFPVRADSLPIADQLQLKRGIYIESVDQLMQLVDDYL